MSGESGVGCERGVHRCLGDLQSRVPLSLHLALAQDQAGVPARQQGLGVPEVREIGVRGWNLSLCPSLAALLFCGEVMSYFIPGVLSVLTLGFELLQ